MRRLDEARFSHANPGQAIPRAIPERVDLETLLGVVKGINDIAFLRIEAQAVPAEARNWRRHERREIDRAAIGRTDQGNPRWNKNRAAVMAVAGESHGNGPVPGNKNEGAFARRKRLLGIGPTPGVKDIPGQEFLGGVVELQEVRAVRNGIEQLADGVIGHGVRQGAAPIVIERIGDQRPSGWQGDGHGDGIRRTIPSERLGDGANCAKQNQGNKDELYFHKSLFAGPFVSLQTAPTPRQKEAARSSMAPARARFGREAGRQGAQLT